MNKRKIFVLLIVLFAVLGISLSAVSAATATIKLDKNSDAGMKIVGKGQHKDILELFSRKSNFEVHTIPMMDKSPNYKITKVKVFFKNKKGKKITKTYKISNKKRLVKKNPKKGYTAYKATVTYSKKK
jgi:hypothetical protein